MAASWCFQSVCEDSLFQTLNQRGQSKMQLGDEHQAGSGKGFLIVPTDREPGTGYCEESLD